MMKCQSLWIISLNKLKTNLKHPVLFVVYDWSKKQQAESCFMYYNQNLKGQSGTKSPVKHTWIEKMIILSTFLEFPINFLINNLKKHYKIWYGQRKKRRQSLNCHNQNLKGQSGTKSPIKPTWSDKMTVLSTFLESSLKFLSNNLKKLQNVVQSARKLVSSLNCHNQSLKGQSGTKSPVKHTWSEKMIILSTFLESPINFLTNNLKNTKKFGTVREKSGVKVWTAITRIWKDSQGQNRL